MMWHWLLDIFLIICIILFMIDGLTFLWVRRVYALVYHLFTRIGGFVILFDLDNLKEINDRFGHQMGDHVLQRVGLILIVESRLRAFRYGGDEFAVILPLASVEEAEEFAEEIRRRINEIDFNGIKVSVSIGIGKNEEEADKSLYKNKTRKPR